MIILIDHLHKHKLIDELMMNQSSVVDYLICLMTKMRIMLMKHVFYVQKWLVDVSMLSHLMKVIRLMMDLFWENEKNEKKLQVNFKSWKNPKNIHKNIHFCNNKPVPETKVYHYFSILSNQLQNSQLFLCNKSFLCWAISLLGYWIWSYSLVTHIKMLTGPSISLFHQRKIAYRIRAMLLTSNVITLCVYFGDILNRWW